MWVMHVRSILIFFILSELRFEILYDVNNFDQSSMVNINVDSNVCLMWFHDNTKKPLSSNMDLYILHQETCMIV